MSWSLRVIWLWNLLVCTLIQYWSWSPGHCTNDYARAGSKTKGAFSNRGRRIYWLLWGNLLDTPTKHISGINHYILSTDFFLHNIHNYWRSCKSFLFESVLTMKEVMSTGPGKTKMRTFQTRLIPSAVTWGKLKWEMPKRDLWILFKSFKKSPQTYHWIVCLC